VIAITLHEEETMATAKKAMCAGKTKQGRKCKKTAVGKSAYCATHKRK
jgi:hypothetical protein